MSLTPHARDRQPSASAPWPLAGAIGLFLLACAVAVAGFGDGAGAAMVGPTTTSLEEAGLATLRNAAVTVLLLCGIYLVARGRGLHATTAVAVPDGVRGLNLVAALLVVMQTLVGAVMRYLALAARLQGRPEPSSVLTWIHGLGSLLATLVVLGAASATLWSASGRPWLRGLSGTVVLLVLAQVFIGLRGGNDLHAHIGVGVALLANTWAMYLATVPARPRAVGGFRGVARDLLALTKPRVTGLVLFTFGAGVWLAPSESEPGGTMAGQLVARYLAATLGTLLLVGAANALNMFIERDRDGRMERTARRPLPAGRLHPDWALGLGTVLAGLALPVLALAANGLTACLGFLAFASYVFAYTPLKPRSWTALFVGALPGALPPLMGWTAVTGTLDAGGLLLFTILFAWQIPHFVAIGLMRGADYARAGHRILPVERGERSARRWGAVFALVTLAASLALPLAGVGGFIFVAGALALGVRFVRSCWLPPRPMFLGSLGYLVLLHVALALDGFVHILVG